MLQKDRTYLLRKTPLYLINWRVGSFGYPSMYVHFSPEICLSKIDGKNLGNILCYRRIGHICCVKKSNDVEVVAQKIMGSTGFSNKQWMHRD